MVGRFLVPPIAGASFSLALLYLYQEALAARHTHIKASLESSTLGLSDVKRGIEARLHNNRSAGDDAEAQHTRNTAWPQQRNYTIGEEMKMRWNHQLVSLTNGLANLQWDSLADQAILATKSLLGSAGSAVSDGAHSLASSSGLGSSSSSSGSGSGRGIGSSSSQGVISPSGGISGVTGLVDTRGANLRTPEERVLKVTEEVQQAAKDPLFSRSETSLR